MQIMPSWSRQRIIQPRPHTGLLLFYRRIHKLPQIAVGPNWLIRFVLLSAFLARRSSSWGNSPRILGIDGRIVLLPNCHFLWHHSATGTLILIRSRVRQRTASSAFLTQYGMQTVSRRSTVRFSSRWFISRGPVLRPRCILAGRPNIWSMGNFFSRINPRRRGLGCWTMRGRWHIVPSLILRWEWIMIEIRWVPLMIWS